MATMKIKTRTKPPKGVQWLWLTNRGLRTFVKAEYKRELLEAMPELWRDVVREFLGDVLAGRKNKNGWIPLPSGGWVRTS